LLNLFRIILISVFFTLTLNASSYTFNKNKFDEARKSYTKVLGYDNRSKEIKYLNQMVYYGTKLNKKVYKYKQELNRLKRYTKIVKKKVTTKKQKKKSISKYSIQSVIQEKNQITINFNKKISKKDIRYFKSKLSKSYRYDFDIKGKFKDAKPTKLSMSNIDKIKIVQYRFNTLRISFFNKYKVKPIYIIGYKKIIIKIKGKPQSKVSKIIPNMFKRNIKGIKTIVIEAGHGGKDAGAVGPRKKYEKTVVLKISQLLYKELKQKGYKVYLTRNKDRYVSLRYRTKVANKRNANMFISIHANAARKNRAKKARGIETYFLSPARSARAKRVAAKENRGDVSSMGWSSKNTFLTVLNQGKITASNKMAIDIQKNMLYSLRNKYGKSTIRDGGVREGPFWILVGAQMPSVLIEVGYISHSSESRRIYTKTYQKLISKAIANGIDSYFLKN